MFFASRKVLVAILLIVGLPVQCGLSCLAEQHFEMVKSQAETITQHANCHGQPSEDSSSDHGNKPKDCNHHGALQAVETAPVLKGVSHYSDVAVTMPGAVEYETEFTPAHATVPVFDDSQKVDLKSARVLSLRI